MKKKNLIDGKVYVAPNGINKVRVYPHGFIEPMGDISEETVELIKEMSLFAINKLGQKATPFQVFEFMGWKSE